MGNDRSPAVSPPTTTFEGRQVSRHPGTRETDGEDITNITLVGDIAGVVLAYSVAGAILWPIVWLLSIPFRVVGIAAEAFLALLKSILFLPARLLGHR